MLKCLYLGVELLFETPKTFRQHLSSSSFSQAKWRPANAFLFGGIDESQRELNFANKVNRKQVRIHNHELLPPQPLGVRVEHCCGERELL